MNLILIYVFLVVLGGFPKSAWAASCKPSAMMPASANQFDFLEMSERNTNGVVARMRSLELAIAGTEQLNVELSQRVHALSIESRTLVLFLKDSAGLDLGYVAYYRTYIPRKDHDAVHYYVNTILRIATRPGPESNPHAHAIELLTPMVNQWQRKVPTNFEYEDADGQRQTMQSMLLEIVFNVRNESYTGAWRGLKTAFNFMHQMGRPNSGAFIIGLKRAVPPPKKKRRKPAAIAPQQAPTGSAGLYFLSSKDGAEYQLADLTALNAHHFGYGLAQKNVLQELKNPNYRVVVMYEKNQMIGAAVYRFERQSAFVERILIHASPLTARRYRLGQLIDHLLSVEMAEFHDGVTLTIPADLIKTEDRPLMNEFPRLRQIEHSEAVTEKEGRFVQQYRYFAGEGLDESDGGLTPRRRLPIRVSPAPGGRKIIDLESGFTFETPTLQRLENQMAALRHIFDSQFGSGVALSVFIDALKNQNNKVLVMKKGTVIEGIAIVSNYEHSAKVEHIVFPTSTPVNLNLVKIVDHLIKKRVLEIYIPEKYLAGSEQKKFEETFRFLHYVGYDDGRDRQDQISGYRFSNYPLP